MVELKNLDVSAVNVRFAKSLVTISLTCKSPYVNDVTYCDNSKPYEHKVSQGKGQYIYISDDPLAKRLHVLVFDESMMICKVV